MNRFLKLMGVAAGPLLLFSACRTPPSPPTAAPWGREELRLFFSRARDPRNYWITVYSSDQGPSFKGNNRLHPEQLAMMSFEARTDATLPLIRIDAWLGREFYALLDTTSAHSWMTARAFHAMRGVPFGPPAYRFRVAHVKDSGFCRRGP